MTSPEFNALVKDKVIPRILSLIETKGEEYAKGAEDRLGVFKRGAKKRSKTPEDVLMGMVLKHDLSIDEMVERLSIFEDDTPSEYPIALWEEKIFDRIVYNILLLGLVMDRGSMK